jgi:hypothetical protein
MMRTSQPGYIILRAVLKIVYLKLYQNLVLRI